MMVHLSNILLQLIRVIPGNEFPYNIYAGTSTYYQDSFILLPGFGWFPANETGAEHERHLNSIY